MATLQIRRLATAVVTLIALAASAGAYLAFGADSAPVDLGPRGLVLDEHYGPDVGFPGAKPHPRRGNRFRRGDADAIRTFRTVRPRGATTSIAATGSPVAGTFSPPFDWPLIGLHAVLTPEGRVLSYGSNSKGEKSGYFIYAMWDPQLGFGSAAHKVLPNDTLVDLFCNAQLLLPTGKIEMWGGDTNSPSGGYVLLKANNDSNLFDPADDSLVRTGKMNRIRWYASATTLPSGEVYLQGGSDGSSPYNGGKDYPEVRTATGQFRLLTGASTLYLNALYPRNFLAPDGKVFGVHFSQMYRVDPTGTGTLTKVGKFSSTNIGTTSTSVMFRPGKILQVGGGLDMSYASPEAHVLDINPALPKITAVARPAHRRHWGNATVLPDGKVFLSGGSTADNDPINGIAYESELYDPQSNTWTRGPSAQRMRLYHATALLLPNATVLTMGGGANGPELNFNAEIYYPPYLFNDDGTAAARPVISSVPMTQEPAGSFRIATPDAAEVTRVTLVKSGSNTHSIDMDQRFLELPFTRDGSDLVARLPANKFDTPPGFYLAFIFNGRGVPSEAMPMRINVVRSDPALVETATLTVRKVVVNDNGGTGTPSNFSFAINGGAPTAFASSGSNVLTLAPGTYTIAEPAVGGYTASYSGCSDVSLVAGGSATCTITNDDVATAPSNLLVNGDFEANSVPDGTGQYVTGLQGWNNKAGPIEVWRNNHGYTPGLNASYIEVDGAPNTRNNRVYQNITTVASASYELSFLHSPRPGNSATSNRFDVYWNGTRVYRAAIEGTGLTNTQWQRVTLLVTGTGATDRVSFFEADTDTDDKGALIDDVRLVRK